MDTTKATAACWGSHLNGDAASLEKDPGHTHMNTMHNSRTAACTGYTLPTRLNALALLHAICTGLHRSCSFVG